MQETLINVIERRIKAQQPDIDALSRNPDNNSFVNYLKVATERRKETVAILEACITHETAEITDVTALTAAFRGIVDRATPAAAMLYEDFHDALQAALVASDNEIREQREREQRGKHAKNDI